MGKLNILVFAKPNSRTFKFVLADFFMELGRQARVQVWDKDNWDTYYILKVMRNRGFNPDFILHYDFVYNYSFAPRVLGLNRVNIPKGVYYFDLQVQKDERRRFIQHNGIDLVFCTSRDLFRREYRGLQRMFRWLPFSIDPSIFKDWKLDKTIDFLLMGNMWKGWYPFRERVLEVMRGKRGFVYHGHPWKSGAGKNSNYIGESYAQEINRAKIFFTCGTKYGYPVKKFFEVLACNTLLIAQGNNDLEGLGFIDGENYVKSTEEDFYDLAMYFLHNRQERERIALNGYNLVHSRHTNQVRVKEFLDMVKQYTK
ncbi:MAG: hypothetical protein HPY66_3299 [Firmicutes bacterium]|nr:hypothetical protein [Bacillota bacterium]